MAHAFLLCFEIALVVGIGFHFNGHVLDNLEAEGFESDALDRVVGHKAYLVNAQLPQYLCSYALFALIGPETEVDVSFHGVLALLLQLVGFHLVEESYAAPFLIHV